MQVALRKLYMRILACMLVLVTTVVTTFAWAGISDYASTERFEISLENDELRDFSLLISLDGVNFTDVLDITEIKKYILMKMYPMSKYDELTAFSINKMFDSLNLDPVSTQRKENNLGPFVNLEMVKQRGFKYSFDATESELVRKSYFDFDIYLCYEYTGGQVNDTILNSKHSILLNKINNILEGKKKNNRLSNDFMFKNYFQGTVFRNVKVNSASAARVALSKFPVVDKGKPANYENVSPTNLIIFQGGTAEPSHNDGVYSFGGLMPAEDNLAFVEYNRMNDDYVISNRILEDFISNRGEEISIVDSSSRWIVNQNDGLTVDKMIKFNVKMWVEGFDADCFSVINNTPLTLSLNFSSILNEE